MMSHTAGASLPKTAASAQNEPAAPVESAGLVEKRRIRETAKLSAQAANPAPDPTHPSRGEWRVVVYKNSDVVKANRKADAINELWPDLNAAVFSATGAPPYEVVVGGTMRRAEARKLIRRLKTTGFPTGTWAKMVSH